jgi:hypothetical protein
LPDNPNCNFTALCSHTATLNGAAASPNKSQYNTKQTLVTTLPNKKRKRNTYCCNKEVPVLSGQAEESLHNLEDPVETEFGGLHLVTTSLGQWQAKDSYLKFLNSNHTKSGNSSPTT